MKRVDSTVMIVVSEGGNRAAIQQLQAYFQAVCVAPYQLNDGVLIKGHPDLTIIFASDYSHLEAILLTHSEFCANPLSVFWCPDSDIISGNDLIKSAQHGIDYILIDERITQLAIARIKGRISANQLFQKKYAKDALFGEQKEYPSRDEELLKRIMAYLSEHNLSNDFSIEKMGKDLGMSRTNFFSRIKSLAGVSPSKLVMNFRLKKAAHLLVTTDRNVSEIAFEVGFSSTAYFTRCFKKTYGMNPSKYTKDQRKHVGLTSLLDVSIEGNIA